WSPTRPWCNITGMGSQRERFLTESLQGLRDALTERAQDLMVMHGSPEFILPQLVRDYSIDRVGASRTPGYYERATEQRLLTLLKVPLTLYETGTLFDEAQLPAKLNVLPKQFSPFRTLAEALPVPEPIAAPGQLPPPPAATFHPLRGNGEKPHTALPIRGGTAAGRRRLRQFVFDQRDIIAYKNTRNCLDPFDGSSTLSPWLANGCLSAREVTAAIRRFEQTDTCNDSTYWLFFELLWREFFHWRAYQDDVGLFRLSSKQKNLYHCTFEPRSFARWCAGDTDFPIVNAIMHQLTTTGWCSNRGRQIAASCLVNELRLDWRYGAAFFEKYLIDYDVACNYGNWQYIAGVGADPRGGRHFNLEKQAKDHDPHGNFTAKWWGKRPPQPKYVTDAADWPMTISPNAHSQKT
ncbi:MAG: DASH family cryptochrome, partial [Halioglobus sp.]|nr:DASH family cryptochrome [Halioglobus sp.]